MGAIVGASFRDRNLFGYGRPLTTSAEWSERGYKGGLYGTHALINPDFVRVGARAVEGVIAPTGPVIVAEQLPDSNPIKKVSADFIKKYEDINGKGSWNSFAAFAFDAVARAQTAFRSWRTTPAPLRGELIRRCTLELSPSRRRRRAPA